MVSSIETILNCFIIWLIIILPSSDAQLQDCPLECLNNPRIQELANTLNISNEILVNPCSVGCRWSNIDRLLGSLYQVSYCSYKAFTVTINQMSCTVGCNITTIQTVPYNNENTSFSTVMYEVILIPISSMWWTTVQEQETSSNNSVADDNESIDLWLILQVLCVILLVFSLVSCCCMCSGEARSYSNQKNRPRDIVNCEERQEQVQPLIQSMKQVPLSTPVTNYTVPIKLNYQVLY